MRQYTPPYDLGRSYKVTNPKQDSGKEDTNTGTTDGENPSWRGTAPVEHDTGLLSIAVGQLSKVTFERSTSLTAGSKVMINAQITIAW